MCRVIQFFPDSMRSTLNLFFPYLKANLWRLGRKAEVIQFLAISHFLQITCTSVMTDCFACLFFKIAWLVLFALSVNMTIPWNSFIWPEEVMLKDWGCQNCTRRLFWTCTTDVNTVLNINRCLTKAATCLTWCKL